MPKKQVNLLNMLGFILILASLSMFWLTIGTRHRPEAPKRALCFGNLKEFALALAMYADRYDGRLPMDSVTPTLVGSMKLLSNVSNSAKFLHCPSDKRPGAKAEENFSKLTISNISYSYVPNLIWQDAPDSIIAADRIYDTSAGTSWPQDGNHTYRGGGGHVLFNDGHVAFESNLPSALKDKNGKQTVLSP